MKEDMTQLYLCEEPYWSKYDGSEIGSDAIQITVISDGKIKVQTLDSALQYTDKIVERF